MVDPVGQNNLDCSTHLQTILEAILSTLSIRIQITGNAVIGSNCTGTAPESPLQYRVLELIALELIALQRITKGLLFDTEW